MFRFKVSLEVAVMYHLGLQSSEGLTEVGGFSSKVATQMAIWCRLLVVSLTSSLCGLLSRAI